MADVIAHTRNGRFVAFRQSDGIHVVDTRGPVPRRVIAIDVRAFACVGDELWLARADGTLWRTTLGSDDAPTPIGAVDPRSTSTARIVDATRIVPIEGTSGALVDTGDGVMLVDRGGVSPSGLDDARVLAAGRGRAVVVTATGTELRTLARRDAGAPPRAVALPARGGVAMAAAWVLGDRAIALWIRALVEDALVVCTVDGKLVHRVAVPALSRCAFADDPALAIGVAGDELIAIDLRYGRLRNTAAIAGVVDLAIDQPRRHLVVARGTEPDVEVEMVAIDVAFAPRAPMAEEPATDAAETSDLDIDLRDGGCTSSVDDLDGPDVDPPVVTIVEEPAPHDADDSLPDVLPLALSAAEPKTMPAVAPSDVPPYPSANAHLTALLDVVAARTALAIAESWHSGRTSHDIDGGLPCEREVLGLLGEDVELAAEALSRARMRLGALAGELAARTAATLAHTRLPFVELAREFSLSPIATQILICAAAPRLRGRIARLYGVLAGLAGRSACTDHLLEVLVEPAPDSELGNAIAAELALDAPIVRAGLVTLHQHTDRLALAVDDVLLDRLRDVYRAVEIGPVTTRRIADRELAEVVAPLTVKQALLLGLSERDPARPARIVVRGRRGSGRHTLVAALAARVGRTIAELDVARLPRAEIGRALAIELVRANLAGAVPVVSGLDGIDRTDADTRRQIEDVLRRHTGPLAVRTTPEFDVPLDPERIDVTLPALTATERIAVWRTSFAVRGLPELDDDTLELLTARFRFGAGTIHRVTDEVARRVRRESSQPASLSISRIVDEVARRHVAGRLERVATRIGRLADWSQVTLVDDMRDSVRELIGRMSYQRLVYDDWGYDRRIATARGLTALFYGPPGTGKTLVAGLIGRELGLEVWRIDLARITSKWIGETEKSLGDVFDAAEEGQVLLLFDEADSLFGKRSEVKSSNDRYANLEVNYLLQRLDSFEGVAILTTNLEGSIDPAFKRRLSMRLYFPFPDEDQRAQLWAAHVPPNVPRAGGLDFADLARRYPLSGGYIRNSALRAAFLAAQERRPLCQDHLVRAVQLEYRELGKLSSSGRME